MKIRAKQLASMTNPYVVKEMSLGGVKQVVAASEGHGPCMRLEPPDWKPEIIAEGPGGCLDVTPLPGANALFMIGGCYPGYKFDDGGVYLLESVDADRPWAQTRLFDMPYVHRLQSLGEEGAPGLITATIAHSKDSPEDWQRSGTVYAVDFPNGAREPASPRRILTGIHRNHGLMTRFENEHRALYVSGDEGVYRARVPQDVNREWEFQRIMERAISELSYVDIDGDGYEELVTIEPFHGNRLVIYRTDSGGCEPWLSHEISYGHGLWTGLFGGSPSIVVSNRAGSKNLELLRLDGSSEGRLAVTTLAEGTSTAQVAVLNDGNRELVFATNQESQDIVLYEVTP